MAGATGKVCVGCGQDVSRKPRTKDAQGRYYCDACWAKAQHPAEAAPYEVDPLLDKMLASTPPPAAEPETAGPGSVGAGVPVACPACSAAMAAGAAVCLTCGFNTKTGKVLKTRVMSDLERAERPAGKDGRKVTLGTNTDWPEVGRIASGIFFYFLVVFGFALFVPFFSLIYLVSLLVLVLYFLIAMVVQPFLEGLYLWGLYHILVFAVSAGAGYYAWAEQEKEGSIIPALMQLPSIYYVFWKCTNDRLKAIWLLALVLYGILMVVAMLGGIEMAAQR